MPVIEQPLFSAEPTPMVPNVEEKPAKPAAPVQGELF